MSDDTPEPVGDPGPKKMLGPFEDLYGRQFTVAEVKAFLASHSPNCSICSTPLRIEHKFEDPQIAFMGGTWSLMRDEVLLSYFAVCDGCATIRPLSVEIMSAWRRGLAKSGES